MTRRRDREWKRVDWCCASLFLLTRGVNTVNTQERDTSAPPSSLFSLHCEEDEAKRRELPDRAVGQEEKENQACIAIDAGRPGLFGMTRRKKRKRRRRQRCEKRRKDEG